MEMFAGFLVAIPDANHVLARRYKGPAPVMALDSDLFVARRFDRLHVRAILALQENLGELEERLNVLEQSHPLQGRGQVCSDQPEVDGANLATQEHTELMSNIAAKLQTYDELLQHYSRLQHVPRPPQRSIENLKAVFGITNNIIDPKFNFITQTEDLISVSAEKPVMRIWFEDLLVMPIKRFLKYRHRPFFHVREKDMDFFGSTVTFITALAMLIAPLWILQALGNIHLKLGVITIFVSIFLLFLSYATLGKPFEILGATAGYAAVLVVFLSLEPGRVSV